MPTVSWIRETVEDRYYEANPGRLGPLVPIHVNCPICFLVLVSSDSLSEHVRAAHPMHRPILLVDGRPAPSELTIRDNGSRIDLLNHTEILAGIDGSPTRPISLSVLSEIVASRNQANIRLTLTNRRASDGAKAHADYLIRLQIPDADGIRQTDRLFSQSLTGEILSAKELNAFVSSVKGLKADEYADALYHYVLGVMAKEQHPVSGVTTPFSKYAEKFKVALSILQDVASPLAYTVATCIRFNLNEFGGWARSTEVPSLDHAMRFFAPLANGTAPGGGIGAAQGKLSPACPIDQATNAILAAVEEAPSPGKLDDDQVRSLEGMIASGMTSEFDRVKLRSLVARRALDCGEKGLAVKHLRHLTHDPAFGIWAINQLNNVGDL